MWKQKNTHRKIVYGEREKKTDKDERVSSFSDKLILTYIAPNFGKKNVQ